MQRSPLECQLSHTEAVVLADQQLRKTAVLNKLSQGVGTSMFLHLFGIL